MYKRITLKIGSNVLTMPDGHPNEPHIACLVEQVVALRKKGVEVLLISSGAVASGRKLISSPKDSDAVSCRQLWASVGQVYLIRLYSELFTHHQIICSQVLATKEDFRDRRHFLNMRNCLQTLLRNQVIPVINENDVVSVNELMFTDNDELSGLITDMMGSDALIILSNIDGIYDGLPSNPASKVIPVIEPEQNMVSKYIAPVQSTFGRGGMLTKFAIAKRVAASGTPVHIANGFTENILQNIVDEKPATVQTYFMPGRKTTTIKKWLAHSQTIVKGTVHINRGAVERLTGQQAASLLLVGVTSIDGDFLNGDVVRIVDEQGKPVGLGRSEYNADTARKKTGELTNKPLIHYDYLYLNQ
ncbi:MAG: glutamate 5-kinase [Bacteroidales bacterium]|jgi:glutamate 5-kinase|nr:glutamate 5-kinase [Bacteroidales bacterium]